MRSGRIRREDLVDSGWPTDEGSEQKKKSSQREPQPEINPLDLKAAARQILNPWIATPVRPKENSVCHSTKI
jgi:hypothetical protein